MSDWELIQLTTSNSVWTRASAELFASYIPDASVVMATDLGITNVIVESGYTHVNIDTSVTNVPMVVIPDSLYGLVGWNISNYYNPGALTLQSLETQSQYWGGFGGDYSCASQWAVFDGGAFVAFKQRKSDENAVLVYDTITNLLTGESVNGFMSQNYIYDVVNGDKANNDVGFSNQNIMQSDGNLYTEIIKYSRYSDNAVYQAENTYIALYDYDYYYNRDKSISIDGVVFNRMAKSGLYIPVE